jgi:hypothetical protein
MKGRAVRTERFQKKAQNPVEFLTWKEEEEEEEEEPEN